MADTPGASATASSTTAPGHRPDWASLPDEKLLELRICDLHVSIEGSFLEPQIHRLFEELDARGLGFRPHVWGGRRDAGLVHAHPPARSRARDRQRVPAPKAREAPAAVRVFLADVS
jgi:hypothetical protein